MKQMLHKRKFRRIFFLLDSRKIAFLNVKFSPQRSAELGQFLPNSVHVFSILKKQQGRSPLPLPGASCAPELYSQAKFLAPTNI